MPPFYHVDMLASSDSQADEVDHRISRVVLLGDFHPFNNVLPEHVMPLPPTAAISSHPARYPDHSSDSRGASLFRRNESSSSSSSLSLSDACNTGDIVCNTSPDSLVDLGRQVLIKWDNTSPPYNVVGYVDIYIYDMYNTSSPIAKRLGVDNNPGYTGFTVDSSWFKYSDSSSNKVSTRPITYVVVPAGGTPEVSSNASTSFLIQGNPATYRPENNANTGSATQASATPTAAPSEADAPLTRTLNAKFDQESTDGGKDATETANGSKIGIDNTDNGDIETFNSDSFSLSTLVHETTVNGRKTLVTETFIFGTDSEGHSRSAIATDDLSSSYTFTWGDISGPGDHSSSDSSLSGGAIAGIVIGILAAVALILLLVWWLWRRFRGTPTAAGAGGGGKEIVPAGADGDAPGSGHSDTPLLGGGNAGLGQDPPRQTDSFMSDFATAGAGLTAGAALAGAGAGAAAAAAAGQSGTQNSRGVEVMPQVYMNIPHSTRSNSNVLIPSMNAAGTAGPADTTTLGAAEAGVVAASAAAAAAPQQRSNEDAPMTEEAQRIFQQVQNAFNQPLSSYPDNSAQLGDDPFSDGLDPQHNDELNPNWRQQVANDRMLQHLANHGAMSLVQPDFTAEPSRATASLRSSTPMQGQPPTSPSPGPSSS